MECDAVPGRVVPSIFNDHVIFLLKGNQTTDYPVTQYHSITCHKSQIRPRITQWPSDPVPQHHMPQESNKTTNYPVTQYHSITCHKSQIRPWITQWPSTTASHATRVKSDHELPSDPVPQHHMPQESNQTTNYPVTQYHSIICHKSQIRPRITQWPSTTASHATRVKSS